MNAVLSGPGSLWLRKILRGVSFAFLLLLPVMLLSQGYFGTVSGELTDSSGAVVQGAKVTLTDQAKGFTFNATSDSSGRYFFASIPPGVYSVSAEMQGFAKAVQNGLKVNVSENATANLMLHVAAATQTVQVEAQTQALATEDAVTGQVINRRFINNLPLIDRYVMDLTYLAPGVTSMDDQCPNCGGTNFVSNGSRGATADILMDGASITNFEPNGGSHAKPPTLRRRKRWKNSRCSRSNFSAEYGFSGASVLNMITRSGYERFPWQRLRFHPEYRLPTPTIGLTIAHGVPFRRFTATISAAPSADRSSRTRLFSSSIRTAHALPR